MTTESAFNARGGGVSLMGESTCTSPYHDGLEEELVGVVVDAVLQRHVHGVVLPAVLAHVLYIGGKKLIQNQVSS